MLKDSFGSNMLSWRMVQQRIEASFIIKHAENKVKTVYFSNHWSFFKLTLGEEILKDGLYGLKVNLFFFKNGCSGVEIPMSVSISMGSFPFNVYNLLKIIIF